MVRRDSTDSAGTSQASGDALAPGSADDAVDVAVLGGGLTGISTALHLGDRGIGWALFERNERLGGHARTDERDGFFFDKTGHWLHLRDDYTKGLIDDLLPGEQMVEVERKSRVFSHGRFTRYPFQANLHGLPADVVEECLLGFVRAWHRRQAGGEPDVADFEQFCLQTFGEGISRHFMVPYNHKLWGVHPREITAEWCTRFVPRPSLEQVVRGAVGGNLEELGYNVSFRYPRQGGIERVTRALAARLDGITRRGAGAVHLQSAVDWVDLERRELSAGGRVVRFRYLVNTMPLPELLRRVRGLPDDVAAVAQQLRCTPVRYLNVATRAPVRTDFHWMYAPEERFPFYRVGIYSNAVPSMAPAGRGSLYVELADRGPLDDAQRRDRLVADSVAGLVEAGIVERADDVLFADLEELRYAYVVFDDNYYPATRSLLGWLEQRRVASCGRYGSWTYNSMEDCILAGRDAAARAATAVPRP